MIEQRIFERFIGAQFGPYRIEQFVEEQYRSLIFVAQTGENTGKYLVRLLMEPMYLQGRGRDEYLMGFQYKASQIAALQHPYLMPIVDYGVQHGLPFLVTPQIAMRTLRSRLDKNGPMDVTTAGRYLDQICTALEYAHQHGVIHGSLSVDCIHLRLDGQILVSNLGLTSMLELYREGRQSDLNAVLGEGSAPEQLLGKPVGSFTDVYALGAVLYHILAGAPVFSGHSTQEVAQQHLYASIPPLTQWRSDLPSGLYSIFSRALAKNASQRFSQPGALANAYHRIVDPNNRTRVPFVASSTAPTPQRDPISLSGTVQITEYDHGSNGALSPVSLDSPAQSIAQMPFSSPGSPLSEPGLIEQEERRVALQRRLGRKGMLRNQQIIVGAVLTLFVASLIFGLVLLLHQGKGAGFAATGPGGQATFFDSQDSPPWTTDALSINVQGLSAPQSGSHYEAWLINNDNERVTTLGALVTAGQNYILHYTGNTDLLSPGDNLEITLENGSPKQPVGNVVLSGTFPTKSFAHVTHLLVAFPETPGNVGMLIGLVQQTSRLNIQADILYGLAANKDTANIPCAAQNMIDIIEGTHGANYRPLATTCPAEVPLSGDGFGLLGSSSGFIAGAAEHATLAISQPDATPFMHQHAILMETALSNIKSWVQTIDQDAIQLRNNPTDLSKVSQIARLSDAAYHGVDANGDGHIDPVQGEAGALTALLQGELMATLALKASS